MKIIAGTGHRPKWMPCKYDEKHPWAIEVKSQLELYMKEVKPDVVISGMAIGWDTWLAEAALKEGVNLWCYLPFYGQGDKWNTTARKRYVGILEQASKVTYTQEHYTKDCFFVRDERMVDDSNSLFALWNPEIKKGGTFYTI